MISGIPIAVMKAQRAVTLKHPNSLEATVYAKKFTRRDPDGGTMGGLATLGGLGQLTPEDEDQFEYEERGEAKILIVSRYEGDIDMTDRNDSIVPALDKLEALIESRNNPPFPIKKYDLIATYPGGGVVIAYEILSLPTTIAIHPFTTKYIIAPRDDLHSMTPFLKT